MTQATPHLCLKQKSQRGLNCSLTMNGPSHTCNQANKVIVEPAPTAEVFDPKQTKPTIDEYQTNTSATLRKTSRDFSPILANPPNEKVCKKLRGLECSDSIP